jgi:hypothetical protein
MKINKLIGLILFGIITTNALLFFFFGVDKKNSILLVTSSLVGVGLVFYIFSKNRSIVNPSIKTINLPSIIFNNTKSFNAITIIILYLTLLFLWYSRFVHSLVIYAISSVFLIAFTILTSPKKMILNQYELIYDKYWKEKWSNIKNFNIKNDVLTLNTFEGKTRIVKNIDSNMAKEIIDFINQKINVTA